MLFTKLDPSLHAKRYSTTKLGRYIQLYVAPLIRLPRLCGTTYSSRGRTDMWSCN